MRGILHATQILITFIENKNIEEVFDSTASEHPVTRYILDDVGRMVFCKNTSTNTINLIENGHKEKSSDEFDKSILEYIDQSYRDSSLSLDTLPEMFNLSESHLSRTFKEKFGVNYKFMGTDTCSNSSRICQ